MNPLIITLVAAVVALLLGAAAGYIIKNQQTEKQRALELAQSKGIIQEAQDRATKMEVEAQSKALKIVQAAENDLSQRRNELNRAAERQDKRRSEMDQRIDRLEQREQAVNKRQSAVDKRANDIEKLHEQQMEKLQEIAGLSAAGFIRRATMNNHSLDQK